jgi:low affinity Fe/Cu permease
MTLAPQQKKLSVFDRIADYVSAAMGRPANIMIWLFLVIGWCLIFALHLVSANATFLPAWFTGTAFNFPLNLVTTVAELFIGFLVAAAANRSERNLELTLAAIAGQGRQVEAVEENLLKEQQANTVLTQQVHVLASSNIDLTKTIAAQTGVLEHMNAELNAIRAAVGGGPNPAAGTDPAVTAAAKQPEPGMRPARGKAGG